MTIIPFEGDFHVHDRATLEWYVRRVAAKQAEIETVRAQGAAMVKESQRELDQLEFLYAAQARVVLERLLSAKRGNSQHLKTLWGNIGLRATPARLTVRDVAQTLEWARTHAPEILETTINRLALTRHFTATFDGLVVNGDGEPLEIPGVTVRAGEQRLYVKTAAAPSSSDDLSWKPTRPRRAGSRAAEGSICLKSKNSPICSSSRACPPAKPSNWLKRSPRT